MISHIWRYGFEECHGVGSTPEFGEREDGRYVLYTDHAAALQAARDEVERLRYEAGLKEETISKSAERTAFALSRAEAAKRRVAELERAASNVIRKAQQKSKLTSSVFTNDLQRLEAALIPAKKVD